MNQDWVQLHTVTSITISLKYQVQLQFHNVILNYNYTVFISITIPVDRKSPNWTTADGTSTSTNTITFERNYDLQFFLHDKIKNKSIATQTVIINPALIICIVANDNTQLLQRQK